MSFDPKRPYNELLLLPPKVDLESKPVLRKTISAGRCSERSPALCMWGQCALNIHQSVHVLEICTGLVHLIRGGAPPALYAEPIRAFARNMSAKPRFLDTLSRYVQFLDTSLVWRSSIGACDMCATGAVAGRAGASGCGG